MIVICCFQRGCILFDQDLIVPTFGLNLDDKEAAEFNKISLYSFLPLIL